MAMELGKYSRLRLLAAVAVALLASAAHHAEAVEVTLASAGNSCPSGFQKITSSANCRAAMGLLPGVQPNEWAGTEKEKGWPSGCYHCDEVDDCEDGFWFNSHRRGSANGSARPVCVSEGDGFGPEDPPPPSTTSGVLFLGDSDIENWDTDEYIPGSSNAGKGGDTCKDVLKRANRELSRHQPQWVVLVCGENDMGGGSSAGGAFRQWKKVVKKVTSSGARVLYIGTKPEPDTKPLHKKYRQFDAKIRRFATKKASTTPEGELPKIVMVDSYAGFVDEGNSNSLYDKDMLHLSDEGYALWERWTTQALSDEDASCVEWRSGECVVSK